MFDFKGQVVIVTGGSRGIGRAVVESFAAAGADVCFSYANSEESANHVCEGIRSKGGMAQGFRVDVRDTESCKQFVDTIEKERGKIDVLVNNAGMIRDKLIIAMSEDDWSDVIQTNLTGCYNMIRPCSRAMLKKRKGAIVNLSSIVASNPGKGHSNYAATKGGVESLTRALAMELGQKSIRVNAVAPGMIETDMTQAVRDAASDQIIGRITLKRYGTPTDIANAILFLSSDYASYITGEVLHVDGGMT